MPNSITITDSCMDQLAAKLRFIYEIAEKTQYLHFTRRWTFVSVLAKSKQTQQEYVRGNRGQSNSMQTCKCIHRCKELVKLS
jgi:hypothetical protein